MTEVVILAKLSESGSDGQSWTREDLYERGRRRPGTELPV
jgi:hypothetical protein